MVVKYEFLEHTADTKIKAYGRSLEEAFESVLVATSAVMVDVDSLVELESKSIVVESKSLKSLLYDFLDEVLFLFDVEGFISKKVVDLKIVRDSSFKLSCTLVGDIASKYDIHTTIKAVTYSDMEIFEVDDGFVIQVVHDL
ncbi:MAG: archease [Candidatus Woesearchaeota archaeon]